jgi:secreted PhoX family phosphatase
VNEPQKATWIDLENVEAPDDDLRLAGFAKGAARFARGEGMWFGRNELYFACTNGGHIAKGQIFRYTPAPMRVLRGRAKTPGNWSCSWSPTIPTW